MIHSTDDKRRIVHHGTQAHRMMAALHRGPLSRNTLREHVLEQQPGRDARTLNLAAVLASLLEREFVCTEADIYDLTQLGQDVLRDTEARGPAVKAKTVSIAAAPAPVIDPAMVRLRMGSPYRRLATATDSTPAPLRPGADACQQHPSRIGNTLHFPDGRVTDLNGIAIPRFVTPL